MTDQEKTDQPPDSETMQYAELCHLFQGKWPQEAIDQLARELADQDKKTDY
jgi:hypothetical protein